MNLNPLSNTTTNKNNNLLTTTSKDYEYKTKRQTFPDEIFSSKASRIIQITMSNTNIIKEEKEEKELVSSTAHTNTNTKNTKNNKYNIEFNYNERLEKENINNTTNQTTNKNTNNKSFLIGKLTKKKFYDDSPPSRIPLTVPSNFLYSKYEKTKSKIPKIV